MATLSASEARGDLEGVFGAKGEVETQFDTMKE